LWVGMVNLKNLTPIFTDKPGNSQYKARFSVNLR
jgi:hypothetical protein